MRKFLTISTPIILILLFIFGCQPEAQVQISQPDTIAEQTEQPVIDDSKEAKAEGQTKVQEIIAKLQEGQAQLEPVNHDLIVTVNGVEILESQIEKEIQDRLDKMAASGQKIPPQHVDGLKKTYRLQLLSGKMHELVIEKGVKKANIVVTEEDINKHVDEMIAKQGLTMEDFLALIEARGQTIDEIKEYVKKGLPYQKLMEQQWEDRINITEQDALDHYNQNIRRFEKPEQVRASHILIKPDASDPNTDPNQAKAIALTKAKEMLKQVHDGADFATLAKDNSSCPSSSKGGDLNYFSKRQMVPAFSDTAFALKVGQVSDIVETKFGYHIIKLTDHLDASVTTFEEAKDDIILRLTKMEQKKMAQQYLNLLKAEADIVYAPGKKPQTDEYGIPKTFGPPQSRRR